MMKNAPSDVEELVVGDVEGSNGFRFRKASSGSDANGEAMVRSKVQKLRADAEKADTSNQEGCSKELGRAGHEPQKGLREETK